MQLAIKIGLTIFLVLMISMPSQAYDMSKHKGAKTGKYGGHGYGRKGPPSDIPKHIRSRTSEDGTAINLNNSQVGIKGISFMASSNNLKNLSSLAMKTNLLKDEGVKILATSPTFQNLKLLSLWDNHLTNLGIKLLASSKNFKNLTSVIDVLSTCLSKF